MKAFMWVLILCGLAVAWWVFILQEPDKSVSLEDAHKYPTSAVKYYAQALLEDRVEDMNKITIDRVDNQNASILKSIQENEKRLGVQFDDYTYMSMGDGQSLRLIPTDTDEGGGMVQMTVTTGQEDGKYYVTRVVVE
ncbi:MAG: hypothetical protein ACLFUS_07440 [Candidatus Sumerlaeia bacterium]